MFKYIILNDTTRDFGHIGCKLVINNIKNIFGSENCLYADRDVSINFNKSEFMQIISSADFVLLNGEGTLHDDNGTVWLEKARLCHEAKKKIYLINSLWQNNIVNKKYLSCFDGIYLRDKLSLLEVQKTEKAEATFVPDLSFYSFSQIYKMVKPAQKDMLIIDNTLKDITHHLLSEAYKHQADISFMYEKRRQYFAKKLKYQLYNLYYHKEFTLLDSVEKVAMYKQIISGRYHACCIAMMLGIPCLGISSNSWKTKSLYQEADLDSYFINYQKENFTHDINNFIFREHINWSEKAQNYARIAEQKIKQTYNEIIS